MAESKRRRELPTWLLMVRTLVIGLAILAIIPIIVFYLFSQRYIVSGVMAGAVKG